MLIKCKECGKEISSQAEICPYCGYKNEKTIKCPYCDCDTGKTYLELQKKQMNGNIEICKECNKEVLVTTPDEEVIRKKRIQEQANIPHCPTCSSTNISKVPNISKAGSVFMFGLLSQKVKKTWHCNNCKYEW